MIRKLAGGWFPLFGTQMYEYHARGDEGARSLLAGLAVLMIPNPFIISRYGMALRKKSPWARVRVRGDERIERDNPLREWIWRRCR